MIGSAVATRSLKIRASEAASWAALATLAHDISSSFFLSSHAGAAAVERVLSLSLSLSLLSLPFFYSCSKSLSFSLLLFHEFAHPRRGTRCVPLATRLRSIIAPSLSQRSKSKAHNNALYISHSSTVDSLSLSHRGRKRFLGLLGDESSFRRESSRRDCTAVDFKMSISCWEDKQPRINPETILSRAWAPRELARCGDSRERETPKWEIPVERARRMRKSHYL